MQSGIIDSQALCPWRMLWGQAEVPIFAYPRRVEPRWGLFLVLLIRNHFVDVNKMAFPLTDAAIYQWECGIFLPTAKRLPEIAKLYGCTIDELLEKDKEDNT